MHVTISLQARIRAAAISLLLMAVAPLATGCDGGASPAAPPPAAPPPADLGPSDLAPPPIPTRRPTTPTALAAPPVPRDTPRSAVPGVLVGEWDGGSGPANADYIFNEYGEVGVVYGNGRTELGTVVVEGSSMTLYLPSGTRTVTWSVEELDPGYGYKFLTLYMDDASYVRQIGGG